MSGYQFGDQWDLNGGLNLVTVPWLVLTAQLNYRYMVHDTFSSSLLRSATPADAPDFPGEPVVIDPTIQNRQVPTTGSTFLGFTPGFQLSLDGMVDSSWTRMTSLYFYSSIPLVRDSNNSLAQGTSFIFGLTRSFQLLKSIVRDRYKLAEEAAMRVEEKQQPCSVVIVLLAALAGCPPSTAGAWARESRRSACRRRTFSLTDLEGKSQSLSQYRGKIVLVNFWATWCKPCTTEMPAMQTSLRQTP